MKSDSWKRTDTTGALISIVNCDQQCEVSMGTGKEEDNSELGMKV
jgi:hypothetical protein